MARNYGGISQNSISAKTFKNIIYTKQLKWNRDKYRSNINFEKVNRRN